MISCNQVSQTEWQQADCQLPTRWTDQVHPGNAWPEYPRPQMVRGEWQNLNGLWDYIILDMEHDPPARFDGKILVPYPVESALSGVKQRLEEDQKLWYYREFSVPETWSNKQILLHFEAVDWETDVWINNKYVGKHKGGYDPFYFDITNYLIVDTTQELMVSVWDPADQGEQARGKQVSQPGGIWYTPTSGIWQTVWLEPVGEGYISHFYILPDIENEEISVKTQVANFEPGDELVITTMDKGKHISTGKTLPGELLSLDMPDANLWSPDSPFLYNIEIYLMRNGEMIDAVTSYFGMRKISLENDEKGITRMFLNNRFVFQNGPLDQGFWPDGLYTPPTEEAMKYDLQIIKEIGFNMLRKHVKVENRRFYYWCDKMGILVWQDMPNANNGLWKEDKDTTIIEKAFTQFHLELKNMILSKYNHPSIVAWVPYNEGWGQYKTAEVADFIQDLDPSRLVNNASGWTDKGVGDMIDRHNYPEPVCPEPEEERAAVLGEFGGLGLGIEGHTWEKENWGYRKIQNAEDLLNLYEDYYSDVWRFMNDPGLSASVYTQITDVETETNGLMTYDRETVKMDPATLFKINTNDYVASPK